ncbi:MAG: nitronate monooxygenase family protein [Pseudomonadota bacterium]|nr:nitronate monooxygenase family protein [Pseudomonadota bacterium]
MKTRATDLLGIDYPILQAPMAGVSTPALAAAVSNAGALGAVGAGAAGGDGALAMMREVRAQTNKPYHVNFFAHETPRRDAATEAAWIESLKPLFDELGAAPPAMLQDGYASFLDDPAQLDAVLEARPPVVSFHFGLPRPEQAQAMRGYGAILLASATCVEEAVACEKAGMDAVIAQGFEAGGHRGVHTGHADQEIGLFALLPQIRDAVSIPVIAAGGVADGRGIAAAFALGADGVQLGTAFVGSPETSAAPRHRALLGETKRETVVTRGVSGRAARGFRNALIDAVAEKEQDAPAYPVAYDAAKALSRAASAAGREGYEVMWAGQAAGLSRRLPAHELVAALMRETRDRLSELNRLN